MSAQPAPTPAVQAPRSFPDRADIKRRLDEAFTALKHNLGTVDVRATLDGLAEVEKLLAGDSAEAQVQADVKLRELEVTLAPHAARWTGRITAEADVKAAVGNTIGAIFAVQAAEAHADAASLLRELSQAIVGYETGESGLTPTQFVVHLKAIEGKAAAAKAQAESQKSRLSAGAGTVQAAIDSALAAISELRLAGSKAQADDSLATLKAGVDDYEKQGASQTDRQYVIRFKEIELNATDAKARRDLFKANRSAWVVGTLMVAASVTIIMLVVVWGKPGFKGSFLESISPGALAATSAGVLLYIMATLRSLIDKFEFKYLPDYFFRFAQAWLYTILLSKLTVVTQNATAVDELAFAFLIGLYVYQIEKALGDIAIRLLPVEKFMEKRGLTAPGSWQQQLQNNYDALFTKFTDSKVLEKVADADEGPILAEFNQVAKLISSGDEEAAGAAMRSLTTKVNRVLGKSGAS